MSTKKKVIVIGGGFAGVQFIRNLDANLFDVLLIDKVNHHQFQPLFYQVATSQLEPSSISFPFRKIFQKYPHVHIRMAEVNSIQTDKQEVNTTIGTFQYDFLVIATGCKTNFFGNAEIAQHAFPLKSTYDAIEIRNHVLTMFESYLSATDLEKEKMLHIVIAGAGPTGVEMAGALAEIKQHILPKDFRGIDFSKLQIHLVEGSEHTLNSMSEKAKLASESYLKNMGVHVMTNTRVQAYTNEHITLSDGTIYPCKTLIWAAGIEGNSLEGINPELIKRGKRLHVNRYNQLLGTSTIFALGDIAYMETPLYPNGHPQLANVAINQAKNAAKNIKLLLQQKTLKEFEYKDLGSMATIGKHKAVVDLPFWKFKGYLAWFVWMFLHLMLILSVKNKLIIFINWAWAYVTKDTSLRLILTNQSKKVQE